jgi:metallo-beta-lactamase family protein
MKLTFLGATGTVTGSKYLVEHGNHRVLIDCGLFQGLKNLRLRNWGPLPVDPASIDAVVLTHAHIDHSGYVPRLIEQGFCGRIHATPATTALCALLLPDSGHLQEEEALFANRHGFSKHTPALPLYTEADARRALGLELQ